MVCIAAFIILILVGVIVAFLSIFNRDLGRKYLKVLKKSWHCFTRRVTFRKCDTNFSDDVKTLLLKKVIIKKPKLVKPLSVVIEIASILIVVISAWSIIEATKAGLALWVFGSCNVSQPENCALGSEVCSLETKKLNWFEEWGEIFTNIPDRLKTWDEAELTVYPSYSLNSLYPNDNGIYPYSAVDVMDPGCSVCMQSYKNQLKDTDFLNSHSINIMLYAIKLDSGEYKFKNSGIITDYFYSLLLQSIETDQNLREDGITVADERNQKNPYYLLNLKLLDCLFTEENSDGVNWQSVFNNELDNDEAVKTIESWLKEWGLSSKQIKLVSDKTSSSEVQEHIEKVRAKVEQEIKPKGIPTLIYNGKKHLGLYKN